MATSSRETGSSINRGVRKAQLNRVERDETRTDGDLCMYVCMLKTNAQASYSRKGTRRSKGRERTGLEKNSTTNGRGKDGTAGKVKASPRGGMVLEPGDGEEEVPLTTNETNEKATGRA